NDLENLNVDKKNPIAVTGESLFTSAEKNMTDQVVATNVNFSPYRFFVQYWTETTYTEEANFDITTRNVSQQVWDEFYRRSLANFKEAARIIATEQTFTDEQVKQKANKLAIIEILTVYTYSILVETFGNIPYSQALDINTLNPVWDDALTIYKDLGNRLNAAMSTLDTSVGSFAAAEDNINNGDTGKWLKFANSLKVRMGLVLADVDATLSRTMVESAAAGAILDNADNATMEYLGAAPNTNPLYADQVLSNRQDYIITNTFVDALNALNDPRREYYFEPNLDDPNTPEIEYVGGLPGHTETFGSFTHVNETIRQPTFPGTIFSAAETEFLLAEAAERGYNVGAGADVHYYNGIEASILEWGGTEADADAYVAQPAVAYATAAGDWKQKIGTQAWIALYNRGYEAWTSKRRLDQPVLPLPDAAVSGYPNRLIYPVNEQTINPANYDAAAAAIGGDETETKLFFDKN
ncbi:MAG TPA: SusD/RagB family nutrient-binding outer membrane lipoprotein, partial [Saprospiraceae bacterium]|nr:SusD/RagB family nutrient-binding outer membrane lipoprotein [Saprospiraceae bacterium]